MAGHSVISTAQLDAVQHSTARRITAQHSTHLKPAVHPPVCVTTTISAAPTLSAALTAEAAMLSSLAV
jgi:hypothetical protein